MKIVSFTTLKNEADIIESFVRYNMNIFDTMVISDNLSNDGTYEILEKLKKEGYNIDLLIDKSSTFDEQTSKNELLDYVKKKYKPDIIVPLDADEFIGTDLKCNPREVIEKYIKKDYLYLIKMENFVVTEKDDNKKVKSLFVPDRIRNVRIEAKDKKNFYKCIIPSGIYMKNNGGRNLDIGAHNYTTDDGKRPKTIVEDKIFIAHYPVRSIVRYTNKAINHSINNLRYFSADSGIGYHLFYMFEKIMKYGTIPKKDFYEYAMYYDEINNPNKEKMIKGLKEKKLDTSFCKNIEMKYTPSSDELTIVKNAVCTSKNVIDNMRNDLSELNKVRNEEVAGLNRELEKCRLELNNIYNSKGYKLLNVFYKAKDKLRKKK